LVTGVASIMMPVDATTVLAAYGRVLRTLVEYFVCDAGYLRHNDHENRTSVMIAEWPARPDAPEPDPLGVVPFDGSDPVFAACETLTVPRVFRPTSENETYRKRVEAASGHALTSTVIVPLVGTNTIGVVGLVKIGDRPWSDAETNALVAIASMFTQVNARISAEESLRLAALTDSTTGLANKLGLTAELERRLDKDVAQGPVTVFFLDLDRLEALNDFYGHSARDDYLAALITAIRRLVGPAASIGRWADHELILLLQPCAVPTNDISPTTYEAVSPENLGHRILQTVASTSVLIDGDLITRTVSVGITTALPGVDSVHEVIVHADQAALVAKRNGGNGIAFFDHVIRAQNALRNDVELHLHGAIKDGQLVLHYQPEVDLVTMKVTAVEALVRWQHPVRGMLPPSDFVDVAETSDLATELGQWVLEEATRAYSTWKTADDALDIELRVNVSPSQLLADDFVRIVAKTLRNSAMPPTKLCLEITENAVVRDTVQTATVLNELRQTGVKVAVDDFGTGFSSLAHLKTLPVDAVKIDREFVEHLATSDADRAIVAAVASLSRAFGLDLVAEGVETAEACAQLVALGCTRAQGFYFSRPLPEPELLDVLKAGVICRGT
jgi:diguanylate cyclase (GGDEF)-like protein